MFDYLPAKLPIFICKICTFFTKNVDSIVESKKILESVYCFTMRIFVSELARAKSMRANTNGRPLPEIMQSLLGGLISNRALFCRLYTI